MKYIIGHQNPDTDSVCSAFVYQNFLKQKNVEAKACVLGKFNNETEFIFKKFETKAPSLVSEIPNGSEIILLDHNEEKQSISNLKDLNIVEIIDHHKVKIETSKPISILIEPVGSTCSIIAKKYFEKSENEPSTLSKTDASLLIAGIISDTLFFRSPTTTKTDKDLVQKLNKIAQIENLEKFSLEMFDAKSDLGNMPIEDIIKLDYKIFEFGGKSYGIGVMETTNKDYGIKKKEDIVLKLKEIKEKENLAGVFFSIIDILNEKSYTITPGETENDLFVKIFNAKNENGVLFVEKLVSRKKQIVPKFEEYLNEQKTQ